MNFWDFVDTVSWTESAECFGEQNHAWGSRAWPVKPRRSPATATTQSDLHHSLARRMDFFCKLH